MPLILSEMYLLIDIRTILPLILLVTSQFNVDNLNIQFHQTYVSNKYVMRNHASNASNLKY